MILGTAGYMSPEQARGAAVDKRADIWAFGCVLYEMLSGKPLFKGETVSDTLAQVLTKEPDWDQVPAKVRRLLRSVPAKGTQAAAHLGSRYGCCGACDRTRRRLVSPLPRETSRACPRSLSGRGPGLEPGRLAPSPDGRALAYTGVGPDAARRCGFAPSIRSIPAYCPAPREPARHFGRPMGGSSGLPKGRG